MRHPWLHPEGDADDATPQDAVPSDASTDRLADRLHREIEDLREGFTDDLLLTLLLLGEDEVEEAVDLLDEGSDRLARFQDRVEHAVADAAVEREAELVLGGLAGGDDRPSYRTRRATRIRAVASVAAAVLAAVVALASVGPTDQPALVTAGAASPALADGPLRSASGPSSDADDRERMARRLASEVASSSPSSPADRLDALLAAGDDDVVLRLGREPRRSVVATLFGVEPRIRNIVEEAGTVVDPLVDEVSESLPDVELPPLEASTEPPDEGSASEEPADDPGPTEEPAEEPTDERPAEEPTAPTPEDDSDAEDQDAPETQPTDDGSSETGHVPGSGVLGERSWIE